jgi:hypothetical protein
MGKVIAVKNQSVYDACLWVYGTITKLNDFLLENGFKADEEISQGQEIQFTDGQGNERIKSKYTREKLIPITPAPVNVCGIGCMEIGSTFIVS